MKYSLYSLTLISLLAFNLKSFSQNIKDPRYKTAIFKAHRIIDELQQKQNIPGIDIAIAIDGSIVWSEAFGFANLEHHVPVISGQTKFRIGSISKPLTAVALGKLLENGKLNLDENIRTYVTYFPEKIYPITVRQVAGHIAGIRHYKDNEFSLAKKFNSVQAGLDIFKDDPLVFTPGSSYKYSSYGYNLLSAVIEEASNTPYLDYMQNNLFSKLNMTATLADKNEQIIHNRSAFYDIDNGNMVKNATYVDNSYKWAGGGFLSTTHDIIRFGNAIINNDFLSKKTLKKLTSPQKLNNGKKTSYGLGFGLIKRGKLKGYGHHGGSVGGTSKFEIYPKQKLVFIVLTNASNVKFDNTLNKIVNLFVSENIP